MYHFKATKNQRTVQKFLGQSSHYARWTSITRVQNNNNTHFVSHDFCKTWLTPIQYFIMCFSQNHMSRWSNSFCKHWQHWHNFDADKVRSNLCFLPKKKVILIVSSLCTISFISNFLVCSCLTYFVTYNEHHTLATICHKTIHTPHKLHVVRTLPSSPFNIHLVIKLSTVPTNLAMRCNMII
jgi:hypothetical protein